jgi:hypothetical protein
MSIQDLIDETVRVLIASTEFKTWWSEQKSSSGDVIIINNSFVFRDVATTKSAKYLGVEVQSDGSAGQPFVCQPPSFNSDFKKFSSKSLNLQTRRDLAETIQTEIAGLGELVFILIGELKDVDILTQPISTELFESVEWHPTLPDALMVEGRIIRVRQTHDEDLLWNRLLEIVDPDEDATNSLRDAFGSALDQLQDQAIARVSVPTRGTVPSAGMTDAILSVLRNERAQYAAALSSNGGIVSNDVLRIAYNFASDATTYLRLIVSVCDLKPLVMWMAIADHHRLSEAFKALPWSRSRKKPSLKNYHDTIADARNVAFHNLFPFRKSLIVSLSDEALQSAELRMFAEHGKKKANELRFRDKELVDLLLEFTRARYRIVSDTFWQRNIDVMDATLVLFERTNSILKSLRAM